MNELTVFQHDDVDVVDSRQVAGLPVSYPND